MAQAYVHCGPQVLSTCAAGNVVWFLAGNVRHRDFRCRVYFILLLFRFLLQSDAIAASHFFASSRNDLFESVMGEPHRGTLFRVSLPIFPVTFHLHS